MIVIGCTVFLYFSICQGMDVLKEILDELKELNKKK